MHTPPSPDGARARRYRLGASASLVLAVLVGLFSFAPAAMAHHSEITASTDCSASVTWTATSWTTGERGVNNSVRVWYTVDNGPAAGATATVGTGSFSAANGYQFSGQFPWPSAGATSITVSVQEQVGWGPNQNLAGVSSPRTANVTLPTNCPSTPTVSASVACADGDGVATVTLSAAGGTQPITFVVTNPVTQQVTQKVVSPGQSTTVTVSGLPDGQVTIPVTADGIHKDQTVNVDCDRPGVPSVRTTVACAEGEGTATVTLANTGGDVDVTFVVTNPVTQQVTQKVVSPGQSTTVTVSGLPDGQVTIPVTADGVPYAQTVTVTCDAPGQPEVSSKVECADGDGTVVVTLANTGGELPVTFVVTNPVTQQVTQKVVSPGQSTTVTVSGLPDGQVTVPVTAGDASFDQTLTVSCDRPGVPEVSSKVVCSDGDGTVVVTLANTSGDLPVTFTVTDPRTATSNQVTVAPGQTETVSLTGVADGSITIPVTAGDASFDQTLTVACDRPGVPAASSKVECADGDGTVVVTLANTGGDLPVTFAVTNPLDGTTANETVSPHQSTTVSFTGFDDGSYTVPVRSGSANLDQQVTVTCDEPGVASIQVATRCSDFDGVVVLTLGNTGGTEPVAYEITDPLTSQVTTVSVPVGGSETVTLTGFPDGPATIPVTADGQPLDQAVTIDCDRPGVPNVLRDVACTEAGGEVTVTLVNTSPAGTAEPITFAVTDPRDGTVTTEVVLAGSTETVVLAGLADGDYAIPVSADGTPLAPVTVTVDCEQPVVQPSNVDCVQDGFVVKLANDGGSPTDVTVTKDGTEVSTVTVPGSGTAEVLVPMAEGETATIEVRSGDEVLQTFTATKRCDPGGTTTVPPGSPTTAPPAEVLGAQVSNPGTPTSGTLPYTGANTGGLVLSAGLLALSGWLLLRASRHMG